MKRLAKSSSAPFFLSLFFLLALFPLFSGGSQELPLDAISSDMAILDESETTVTFREADGSIVELPKHPGRPIVALNSILDLWYMSGGSSLARVRGSINVPEEAAELPILGSIGNLNTELMMELEPDFLVFTTSEAQLKARELFSGEGVLSVAISYNTYDDFRVVLDLFTRLNGRDDLYEELLMPIQRGVQGIINQVPDGEGPSVCILFASTRYVKVETENTITGDYCKDLGARNIYAGRKGESRVELSLEYILEQDPDLIFVTTMGDVEKCRARMDKDIIASDIWGDLSAVRNGRFFYLDKSYSIYKPNRFYPEAYRIMAEYLYPETEFSLESR